MTIATLSFAADRSPGGVWSNFAPHLRTQALLPQSVDIADARQLGKPARLEEEGFVLRHARVPDPNWRDADWIERIYVPSCIDLVRSLTGSVHAAPLHAGALIRDSSRRAGAPAADFVHLDNMPEAGIRFAERVFPAEILAAATRIRVFNVWRVITPPPQDVPLALCDQRHVDRNDWVVGETVEPDYEGAPYIASLVNPAQRWFYFPDMTEDEALVFKGFDSAPDAPFGCLHGAFRLHETNCVAVPRKSVETRVIVLD